MNNKGCCDWCNGPADGWLGGYKMCDDCARTKFPQQYEEDVKEEGEDELRREDWE